MFEHRFLEDTRASYDAIAADYAELFKDELATKPLDRALLTEFADLVRGDGTGPVADVGCGPGYVTSYLNGMGLDVFGIDLSPRMVDVARRLNPDLRFVEGSMSHMDLPDGSLGGLVGWYSIIHVPQERLPGVFAEFERVLAPGGYLLLAFQVGDSPLRRAEAFGNPVSLVFHRLQPDSVIPLLTETGLNLRTRSLRQPYEGGPETTQQSYLLFRKPEPGE